MRAYTGFFPFPPEASGASRRVFSRIEQGFKKREEEGNRSGKFHYSSNRWPKKSLKIYRLSLFGTYINHQKKARGSLRAKKQTSKKRYYIPVPEFRVELSVRRFQTPGFRTPAYPCSVSGTLVNVSITLEIIPNFASFNFAVRKELISFERRYYARFTDRSKGYPIRARSFPLFAF